VFLRSRLPSHRRVGSKAPTFTLTTNEGNQATLKDFLKVKPAGHSEEVLAALAELQKK
jgi:hypothetical protein